MQFKPSSYVRSAHLQTILASRIARVGHLTSDGFEADSITETLTSRDGVRLQALINTQPTGAAHEPSAPLVILLHGWLGSATSTYVRRCAAELYRQGYSIARLQLRDHGDTAHLNEALFHSARLTEVLDACNALGERLVNSPSTRPGAIVGFSLGGNFTLRLAGTNALNPHFKRCIAICPAVNPTTAAIAIDTGWFGYRWYFVQRWQKALTAKAAAFPKLYTFAEARKLTTVAALTDYFVDQHTEFADAPEYYSHYQVTPDMLINTKHRVTMLAAADDPVIPIADIRDLANVSNPNNGSGSVEYIETTNGGHCGFIDNFSGSSPIAGWLAAKLQERDD